MTIVKLYKWKIQPRPLLSFNDYTCVNYTIACISFRKNRQTAERHEATRTGVSVLPWVPFLEKLSQNLPPRNECFILFWIMNTVKLETAKKLLKNWRKTKCQFERFHPPYESGKAKLRFSPRDWNTYFDTSDVKAVYQAPTAQEILDELKESEGSRITVRREPLEDKYFFCAWYLDLDWIPMSPVFSGAEMAEALALLRLWCKKNGYLS